MDQARRNVRAGSLPFLFENTLAIRGPILNCPHRPEHLSRGALDKVAVNKLWVTGGDRLEDRIKESTQPAIATRAPLGMFGVTSG